MLAIETGEQRGFLPDERLPDPAGIMVLCSSLNICQVIKEDGSKDGMETGPARFDRFENVANLQVRLAHFSERTPDGRSLLFSSSFSSFCMSRGGDRRVLTLPAAP